MTPQELLQFLCDKAGSDETLRSIADSPQIRKKKLIGHYGLAMNNTEMTGGKNLQ